jgi:2-dehydropantoate 2-reductase
MRIAVFGTGGVGGYFGGRLAEAGEDVVFLARGPHLAAMLENGLRVSSVAGDFTLRPVAAFQRPAQAGVVDVVLLGVKAWQVLEAASEMVPMLHSSSYVVPLQNGVEAPRQLAEVLGRERVVGGMCRISASIKEPGWIQHTGVDPYIAFGELDNTPGDRLERLRAAFSRSRGVTAEIPGDIVAAMWSKFLFISAVSGVGAITQSSLGVIRAQPDTRRLLVEAMDEARAVAVAHGVTLPTDEVDQIMARIDQLPPDTIASMHRDIAAGRPSELLSQSGAVVRLGQEIGLPVPVHTLIYESLLPLERRARAGHARAEPAAGERNLEGLEFVD